MVPRAATLLLVAVVVALASAATHVAASSELLDTPANGKAAQPTLVTAAAASSATGSQRDLAAEHRALHAKRFPLRAHHVQFTRIPLDPVEHNTAAHPAGRVLKAVSPHPGVSIGAQVVAPLCLSCEEDADSHGDTHRRPAAAAAPATAVANGEGRKLGAEPRAEAPAASQVLESQTASGEPDVVHELPVHFAPSSGRALLPVYAQHHLNPPNLRATRRGASSQLRNQSGPPSSKHGPPSPAAHIDHLDGTGAAGVATARGTEDTPTRRLASDAGTPVGDVRVEDEEDDDADSLSWHRARARHKSHANKASPGGPAADSHDDGVDVDGLPGLGRGHPILPTPAGSTFTAAQGGGGGGSGAGDGTVTVRGSSSASDQGAFGYNETLPIANFLDAQYYGPLSLGSPPQQLMCVYDSGSANLVVLSANASAGFLGNRTRYTHWLSTTYHEDNRPIAIEYGSGAATGFVSNDTIRLGSLEARRQAFGEIVGGDLTHLRAGAILGLGFQALSQGSLPLPFDSIAAANGIPRRWSMYLSRVNAVNRTHPLVNITTTMSRLYLGGKKAGLAVEPWVYAPLVAESFWVLAASSVLVGHTDVCSLTGTGRPCLAIVDTGTSFLGVPTTRFDQVLAEVTRGHVCETLANTEYVACRCSGGMASFPTLEFNVITMVAGTDGRPVTRTLDLRLAPEDYMHVETFMHAKYCIPEISSVPPLQADLDVYLLGDTLLRTYYTEFDMDAGRIGFGRLSPTPPRRGASLPSVSAALEGWLLEHSRVLGVGAACAAVTLLVLLVQRCVVRKRQFVNVSGQSVEFAPVATVDTGE